MDWFGWALLAGSHKALFREMRGISYVEYVFVLTLVGLAGLGVWSGLGSTEKQKICAMTSVLAGTSLACGHGAPAGDPNLPTRPQAHLYANGERHDSVKNYHPVTPTASGAAIFRDSAYGFGAGAYDATLRHPVRIIAATAAGLVVCALTGGVGCVALGVAGAGASLHHFWAAGKNAWDRGDYYGMAHAIGGATGSFELIAGVPKVVSMGRGYLNTQLQTLVDEPFIRAFGDYAQTQKQTSAPDSALPTPRVAGSEDAALQLAHATVNHFIASPHVRITGSPDFVAAARSDLETIASTRTGRALLDRLRQTGQPLEIRVATRNGAEAPMTRGMGRVDVMDPRSRYHGILDESGDPVRVRRLAPPTGSQVEYSPTNHVPETTSDALLLHELRHALGTMEGNNLNSGGYRLQLARPMHLTGEGADQTRFADRWTDLEEYRATRFENRYRRERGLPERWGHARQMTNVEPPPVEVRELIATDQAAQEIGRTWRSSEVSSAQVEKVVNDLRARATEVGVPMAESGFHSRDGRWVEYSPESGVLEIPSSRTFLTNPRGEGPPNRRELRAILERCATANAVVAAAQGGFVVNTSARLLGVAAEVEPILVRRNGTD